MANGTVEATLRPEAAYVRHIHESCKEEIEGRWARQAMTDEEANDLLFKDVLKDKLDEMPKKIEALVKCV